MDPFHPKLDGTQQPSHPLRQLWTLLASTCSGASHAEVDEEPSLA